jgi:hypothetical protein
MPRLATTLSGITLVAFSIGLNTVRYPVVWKMVGCRETEKPAQVAVAPQPENINPQSPAKNPTPAATQPPKPIEVKSKPHAAKKKSVDSSRSVEAGAVDYSLANETPTIRETESRKPLVPVAKLISSGTSERGAVGGAEVRRLPPVDMIQKSLVGQNQQQVANGAIPIYPTTGLE